MEELTLKDFVDMEKIDHQYFPNANITPAKEAYNWYLKDKNTIVALKEDGVVVAYINLLSLKKEIFDKIKHNQMNESQTKMADLETNKDKYMEYLYFASIAVEKGHRDLKTATKLFLKCREMLKNLLNSNIKIKEVMADCSTKEGKEIAKRILHLKPYMNTSHNSEIYVLDGNAFIKNLKI